MALWSLAWLVLLSLVPPLLFLVRLRNSERIGREPWNGVLRSFGFGATGGVALALLFSVVFDVGLATYGVPITMASTFVAVLFVAPLAEEAAKALGLPARRALIREPEDGIIYGAALGLGFAATENLVYGVDAWLHGGNELAFMTVTVRTLSAMLVHAGASAIVGFGYGMAVLRGQVGLVVIPHYFVAAALHSGYNFIASRTDFLGLAAAITVGLLVAGELRRRIQALDSLPHVHVGRS